MEIEHGRRLLFEKIGNGAAGPFVGHVIVGIVLGRGVNGLKTFGFQGFGKCVADFEYAAVAVDALGAVGGDVGFVGVGVVDGDFIALCACDPRDKRSGEHLAGRALGLVGAEVDETEEAGVGGVAADGCDFVTFVVGGEALVADVDPPACEKYGSADFVDDGVVAAVVALMGLGGKHD